MDDVFTSTGCFVSTITLAAMKMFGPQSLQWDPYILRDQFQTRTGRPLSQRLFDKLNCGYALVGTNGYTGTIQGFLAANSVMSGDILQAQATQYNSMQDIAWGVWEYMNLTGQMENGVPTELFSPDITLYIRELAKMDGFSVLPEWLGFADPKKQLLQRVSGALASDIASFQAYQARQQRLINDIRGFVVAKQAILAQQLKAMEKALKTP